MHPLLSKEDISDLKSLVDRDRKPRGMAVLTRALDDMAFADTHERIREISDNCIREIAAIYRGTDDDDVAHDYWRFQSALASASCRRTFQIIQPKGEK